MNRVYASLLLCVTFSYSMTKPVHQKYSKKEQLSQLGKDQPQNTNILDPVFDEYRNIKDYPDISDLYGEVRPHALFYRNNQDDLPKEDMKMKNQRKVLKKIRIYRKGKSTKVADLNTKIAEKKKSYAIIYGTPSNGELEKSEREKYSSNFELGLIRTRSAHSDHQGNVKIAAIQEYNEDLTDLSKDEITKMRDPNLIKETNSAAKEFKDISVDEDYGGEIAVGENLEVTENLSTEEILANAGEISLSEFIDYIFATAENAGDDGDSVAQGIGKTDLQGKDNLEGARGIDLSESMENLTSSIMSAVGEKFDNFLISKVESNTSGAEGSGRFGKSILDLPSKLLEKFKEEKRLPDDAENQEVIILVVEDDFGRVPSALPAEKMNISNVNLRVKEIGNFVEKMGVLSTLDKSEENASKKFSAHSGDNLSDQVINELKMDSSSKKDNSLEENSLEEGYSYILSNQVRAVGNPEAAEETTLTSENKSIGIMEVFKRTNSGKNLDLLKFQQKNITDNNHSEEEVGVKSKGISTRENPLVESENMEKISSLNTLGMNVNISDLAKIAKITFSEGPMQGGIAFEREQQLEARNSKSLVSSDNEDTTFEKKDSSNSMNTITHIDNAREEKELSPPGKEMYEKTRKEASITNKIKKVEGTKEEEQEATTSLINLQMGKMYEQLSQITSGNVDSIHDEPLPMPMALTSAEINSKEMQSNFTQSNDKGREEPISKLDPSVLKINTERLERKIPTNLLLVNSKMNELRSNPFLVNQSTNEEILFQINSVPSSESSNHDKEDEIVNKEFLPVLIDTGTNVRPAITPLNQIIETAFIVPLPVAISLLQNSPTYRNADNKPEEPLSLQVPLAQSAQKYLQWNLTTDKDIRASNKDKYDAERNSSNSIIKHASKFPGTEIITENITVETDDQKARVPVSRNVFKMQDETSALPSLTKVADLHEKISSFQVKMDKNVNTAIGMPNMTFSVENMEPGELLHLPVTLALSNTTYLVDLQNNNTEVEDELVRGTTKSLYFEELQKGQPQITSIVTDIEKENELPSTPSESVQKIGTSAEKQTSLDFRVNDNYSERQEKVIPTSDSELEKTEIINDFEEVRKFDDDTKHIKVPFTSTTSKSKTVSQSCSESDTYAIETRDSVSMEIERFSPETLFQRQPDDEITLVRKTEGIRNVPDSEVTNEPLPQANVFEGTPEENNVVLQDLMPVTFQEMKTGDFIGEVEMRNPKEITDIDVSLYKTAILLEHPSVVEFSDELKSENLLGEIINKMTDRSHDKSEIVAIPNFDKTSIEPNGEIALETNKTDGIKDVTYQKVSVGAEKSLIVESKNLEAMHNPDTAVNIESFTDIHDTLSVTSGEHSDSSNGKPVNIRSGKGGIIKTDIIDVFYNMNNIPVNNEVRGSDKSGKDTIVHPKVNNSKSFKPNSQSTADPLAVSKMSTPAMKSKEIYEKNLKKPQKKTLRGDVKYFDGANFKLFRDARVLEKFNPQKPAIDMVVNKPTLHSGGHITSYSKNKFYSGQSFFSSNSIVNENPNSWHGANELSSLHESSPPLGSGRAIQHEKNSRPANYYYRYKVNDRTTGDIKSQEEERVGAFIRGTYSLNEADGTVRTVDYQVNGPSGFQAVVKRTRLSVPE